jgi:hypothetical protein
MLCLMRDEDWTCREAEVRLAEHRERRAARGLHGVPDSTTLYRFLRRLDKAVLPQALRAVVQRLSPHPGPQAAVAVDATELTPGAISPCFVKRAKDREPGFTWLARWSRLTRVRTPMSNAGVVVPSSRSPRT